MTESRSAKPHSSRAEAQVVAHDRYGIVCGLIVLVILSAAVLGDGVAGLLLTVALMTLTLVIALRTSNAERRWLLLGSVVSLVAFAAIGIALLTGNLEPARLAYGIAMVGLAAVTPSVIGRRLVAHAVINRDTVAGAAAIYLLIGLLFSVLYSLIGVLVGFGGHGGSAAFFSATRAIVPSDFIYYSFTTLTTVGYGDITAAPEIGRLLSVVEALIGQLYLVTIVALVVGNIGRPHPARAENAEQPTAD